MSGKTYFKHKSLHKYTQVTRWHDRVEVNPMIDLVFAKKEILHHVQDVKIVRGVA